VITQVLVVRKEMTEKLARLKEVPTPATPTSGWQHAPFTFDNSVLTDVVK